MTGSILQMIAGLAVVLAAIGGAAWLARRVGYSGGQGARLMKVVAALPVGAKERVVVVEIGEQWLLLGVAPGRVSTLATLPRGELPAAGEIAPGVNFSSLLAKAKAHARR